VTASFAGLRPTLATSGPRPKIDGWSYEPKQIAEIDETKAPSVTNKPPQSDGSSYNKARLQEATDKAVMSQVAPATRTRAAIQSQRSRVIAKPY
jgi:hypothetical protein